MIRLNSRKSVFDDLCKYFMCVTCGCFSLDKDEHSILCIPCEPLYQLYSARLNEVNIENKKKEHKKREQESKNETREKNYPVRAVCRSQKNCTPTAKGRTATINLSHHPQSPDTPKHTNTETIKPIIPIIEGA